MSRSIGDLIGKDIGIIWQPHVNFYNLKRNEKSCIVLGSDGVWDVMSNEELMKWVFKHRNESLEELSKLLMMEL